MKKEKIGRIARGCLGVCAVLAAVAGIFRETFAAGERPRGFTGALCVYVAFCGGMGAVPKPQGCPFFPMTSARQ